MTAQHRIYQVNDLAELAARYEQKWPEILYAKGGSRAQRAMQFVVEGRISHEGRDAYGNDVWVVNGHRCSREGKWCDCEDRVRTDAKYGKLCAHRLAVALKTNWMGGKNGQLLNLLCQLTTTGDRWTEGMTLIVERLYAHHGDGERSVVAGWLNGRTPQRMPVTQRIEFTLPQMQHSLEQIGWSMAGLPVKLPGETDYLYTFEAGPGLELTPELFYWKGRTPQMEERARSRRMILTDIAANLPTVLAGEIPIRLAEWEAKIVWNLRQQMLAEEITAAEVWSRLPGSLRAAIVEREVGEEMEIVPV